jgi:uncharacterized protein (DUF2147 family)
MKAITRNELADQRDKQLRVHAGETAAMLILASVLATAATVHARTPTVMDGEYRGGGILDPDSGSIYRCKFRLVDGGTRLKVRGFLGVSLFGRSQTWERER